MTTFLLPTSMELREVAQDLMPRMLAQRPWAEFFPPSDLNDAYVAWEQEDNWTGLQQLRGLNGAPPVVKRTGLKRFVMNPGIYGEFSLIDETEITTGRTIGTFGNVVDLRQTVAKEQMRLLQRRLDRIESIVWTLLVSGTFSVSTITGAVAHTDSYTTQTFSAIVAWATANTATPLADLRSIKLLARGHSVSFDQTATAYMNSVTANRLFNNTNNADLYGRRTQGLGTFNSLDQINGLLTGDGLPKIREYDQGYLDDSATFQPYIPDGKVVVIGSRPGDVPVGEYLMTRNANNPNEAPGPYMAVVDNNEKPPRSIEIHDGHNGGPAIYWPSSVVVMTV